MPTKEISRGALFAQHYIYQDKGVLAYKLSTEYRNYKILDLFENHIYVKIAGLFSLDLRMT